MTMKPRVFLTLSCAAFGLFPCGEKAGAAPEAGSPEAVVEHALVAMTQDRPDEFARSMHPQALKHFHTAMLQVLEIAAKDSTKLDQLLPLFQVKQLNELKKLDDHQFFVRYMRGAAARDAKVKENLARSKPFILGHVPDGTDTMHVVYRLSPQPGDANAAKMDVMSLRRQGANWAILLAGDTEVMLTIMKEELSGHQVTPDFKNSKIHPLGRLLEGKDLVHVVYRIVTAFGDASHSKVAVVTVSRSDPGWDVAQLPATSGKLIKLIREKTGLEKLESAAPAQKKTSP
jgi:hypothetical protein